MSALGRAVMAPMSPYFTEKEERDWRKFVAAARDEHAQRGRLEAWSREQIRRAKVAAAERNAAQRSSNA